MAPKASIFYGEEDDEDEDESSASDAPSTTTTTAKGKGKAKGGKQSAKKEDGKDVKRRSSKACQFSILRTCVRLPGPRLADHSPVFWRSWW